MKQMRCIYEVEMNEENLKKTIFDLQKQVQLLKSELNQVRESVDRDMKDNWRMVSEILEKLNEKS